ncbi:hypothetical protein VIAG107301_15455 [Vibrio agarivorans]
MIYVIEQELATSYHDFVGFVTLNGNLKLCDYVCINFQ